MKRLMSISILLFCLSFCLLAQPASYSSSSTTGTHNGHRWVDLGLSVKWATCNVGASTPERNGSYFAWGETCPKRKYIWKNLIYCNNKTGDSFSKYNQDQGGTRDSRTVLELSDDAARQNWGGNWRMPTDAEFKELKYECTWTWITMNGKSGYKVVSNINGNFIFLPAAGSYSYSSLYETDVRGWYWSSSLDEGYSSYARYFRFDAYGCGNDTCSRKNGLPVRPVCP